MKGVALEEHMSNYINHLSHHVSNSSESKVDQNNDLEASLTIGSESEMLQEQSEAPASSKATSRKKKPRAKKEQGLRREIDDLDSEIINLQASL